MLNQTNKIKFNSIENVEIINEIKLPYAVVKLRSDGIVHVHTLKEMSVELEEAMELVKINQKITNNTPHLCLFTSTKFVIPSDEAVQFLSGKTNRDFFNIAEACLIYSLPQRILGNFYHNVIKPKRPIKFFKSEEAAVNWLLKQKD